MTDFATRNAAERRLVIEQVAAREGVVPVIVEKDFWVCWLLARVFGTAGMAPHIVFKGGTSLSKVFGVIDRFSEDIDLSMSPESLGFTEAELNDVPSASQRRKRVKILAERCTSRVRDEFHPAMEAAVTDVLGRSSAGASWLRFDMDEAAGTPNLWFAYPSALPQLR
ncbi:MAG: nucleotidyl transferase AbiEii/AbiGii toxin family protein [Sulfuricaulis sp.]|nr:nucleotidyl transferase AbiEii/AbiGii toxin family protein [Sulfuricaulis sp.]